MGGYAFLAGYNGLDIVKIENPANPKVWREFAPDWQAMVGSGKFAYVAGGADGFQVWDMEAAQGPVEISNYQAPRFFEDVAVSGSHVFIWAWDDDGYILCFDVSEPLHPALLSEFRIYFDDEVFISLFSGDYAYICTADRSRKRESQQFYILDLSTPSNPHYISSIQSRASAEEPYCMVVSDGYAYVADSAGLQVLNVQDGAHPVTMRTYPFLATCMAKANNLLCTWYAGEPHRLHFYEINAPGEVVSAGVLEGSWDLKSMAVTNHMLYLSDKRVGLVVLDVHNPASVKIAGGNSLKTDGRIFFSNDKLFLLQDLHYDGYGNYYYGVAAYPLFKPEVRFDSVSRQGPVTLSLSSPVGHNISLERSANLWDWEPWQTIVSSNRVMHVVDPDPVLSVPRFYRAVMP